MALRHFVLQSTTKPSKIGYESHVIVFLAPDGEVDFDTPLKNAIASFSKYEEVDVLVDISYGMHDGYRYVTVDYVNEETDDAVTDDYYLFEPSVHSYKKRG